MLLDLTHPYSIYLHGSADKLPSVAMGSGSLAMMAAFEDKFRSDMEEGEAKKLVSEVIAVALSLTWGLEETLTSVSSGRTSWIYCLHMYSVPNKKGTRFGQYGCGQYSSSHENITTTLEVEGLEETVQTMDNSRMVSVDGWLLP